MGDQGGAEVVDDVGRSYAPVEMLPKYEVYAGAAEHVRRPVDAPSGVVGAACGKCQAKARPNAVEVGKHPLLKEPVVEYHVDGDSPRAELVYGMRAVPVGDEAIPLVQGHGLAVERHGEDAPVAVGKQNYLYPAFVNLPSSGEALGTLFAGATFEFALAVLGLARVEVNGRALPVELLGLGDAGRQAELLVADFWARGGILTTGIFGTMLAFDLLNRAGHNDVVEAWLTRTEHPSLLDMLAGGNGALAEQFTEHLSSYDHAMFTSYAQWFMRALGGIRVADNAVAANRVIVDPYFSSATDAVSCSYQTPHGRIEVRWQRTAGGAHGASHAACRETSAQAFRGV